jgi:hypothetical protein
MSKEVLKMRYKRYRSFVNAALFFLVTGCAASTIESQNIRALPVHKERTIDVLGPFDFERRVYIHETMDGLAKQLWGSGKRCVLKSEKTKGSGKFFETFPILELADKDLDGKADQFAYLTEKGNDSREFGFVFDLNRDGKVDYIVFNGGLLPVITKDKKLKKLVWHNYHWIDSNYDGRVDIQVYTNYIDLDGDKSPDEAISGWVYDTDFDGLIDKAEYLGDGFQQPAEKKEEFFVIKTPFGEDKWGPEEGFHFADMMLSDINSLMH